MRKYLARLNPRRDAVESEVVGTLRACGALVIRLSVAGYADLLCGYQGAWWLIECKARRGTHTQAQKEAVTEIRRRRLPYAVVRSPEEALELLDTIRRKIKCRQELLT